jgi:hypothetical protein
MFRITQGKGFQITFESGWLVSVQFGPFNYCDHYNVMIGDRNFETVERELGTKGSSTAEVWCIHSDGRRWPIDPLGYQTPAEVAQIIAYAASDNFPAEEDES